MKTLGTHTSVEQISNTWKRINLRRGGIEHLARPGPLA